MIRARAGPPTLLVAGGAVAFQYLAYLLAVDLAAPVLAALWPLGAALVVDLALEIVTALAALVLVAGLGRGRRLEDLGLRPMPAWPLIRAALGGAGLAVLIAGGLAVWVHGLDWPPVPPAPAPPGWTPLLYAQVLALVPLVEELLFRGALQGALRRHWPAWPSILVSATAFALAHQLPFKMIATFALGLALGWIAERSGSIWPAISAHAGYNGVALNLPMV